MKKRFALLSILAVVMITVWGCGGGSGGGPTSTANDTSVAQVSAEPTASELEAAKASLSVQADQVTFTPAMVRNYISHLSDGTSETFIDKSKVSKVFWNGGSVGFHKIDPAKGQELMFNKDNPTIVIPGKPLNETGGNFSFLLDDGREFTQNTDPKWLTISVADGSVAQLGQDNLLYGAPSLAPVTNSTPESSPAPDPVPSPSPEVAEPIPTPEPTPIPTPTPTTIQNPAKTLIEINTATGQIDITPIFEAGKILNLVDSNPAEIVLDANGQVITGYRIAWNDIGNWYPTGGKIMPLLINKTTFVNAARPKGTGSGMPYLLKPDGSFIPFNTNSDQCIFKIDGIPAAAWENGLIQY